MRVTLVSTNDVAGGAARAASRLHQGLRVAGVDSRMLVQDRSGDDPCTHGPIGNVAKAIGKLRPYVEAWALSCLAPRVTAPFSAQLLPGTFPSRLSRLKSDIVHLHWVCCGFVRIEHLAKVRAPLVWTCHDAWPLTGGCHYPGECLAYERHCGKCPALRARRERDLSRWVWRRKEAAWRDLAITVVAPSQWMAECARRSALFRQSRIEAIPNGVDTDLYRPMDRALARERTGLPLDRKIVMFSAMMATSDPRKGFPHLCKALHALRKTHHDVEALVVGAGLPANPPDFGMKVHYMGRCHDDLALALLYASADVLVVSSEEDNSPNTILEAMAAGVPTVAFRVGGIPGLIRHQVTGYLASPRDPEDLGRGVAFVLADSARWASMSHECRRTAVAEYGVALTAKRHTALYEDLLRERSREA